MVKSDVWKLILTIGLMAIVIVGLPSSSAGNNRSVDESQAKFGQFHENQVSTYPTILSAHIEPSKVLPGDTMQVTAEVRDDYGVGSVIADMGGIETVNLELSSGSAYHGTWTGEWLVHDTEAREYETSIIATNVLGNSSAQTIEWSDPPVDFVCKIQESGGDYSSLSEWEENINSNLTSTSSMVFSVSAVANGGIADNQSCTGQTSGATGTCKHLLVNNSKVYIVVTSGTFQSGETIQQDSDNTRTVTISDSGNQIGAAVAEIDGAWTSADTNPLIIDGWTTDETHYINICTTSTARHNGKWDTSKYRIEVSNAEGIRNLSANDLRIDGLQVHVSSSAGGTEYHICIHTKGPPNPDFRVSNCLVRGSSTTHSYHIGIALCNGSGTAKVWNCIAYDFLGDEYSAGFWSYGSGITFYAYNNTVQNNTNGFKPTTGSVMVAKNNLSYNNIQNYDNTDGGSFHANSTNNLSGPTQTDAPGSNSRNGVTVTFIDETNDDFHLASNDAGAKDYGTDLSGDANLAFSNDIDGVTRSGTWDIGADETLPGPGQVTLSSPPDGAYTSDTTPDFSWNAVSGTVTYELQVDDAQDFATPLYYKTGISGTTHTVENVLSDITLYWRVRAKDELNNYGAWSDNRSLNIDITNPAQVTLASPGSGTSTSDTTPDFSWNAVTDNSVTYELQIDDAQDFATPVYYRTGISGTTHTAENALSDGTYYWRVRAKDAASNYGTWSDNRSLIISTAGPAQVTLSSPGDGTYTSDTTPDFSWNAVSGTVTYELQVDDAQDFAIPVYYRTGISGTTHTAENVLPNATLYWRVRAKDDLNNYGAWSDYRSLNIDTTEPVQATLLSPGNGTSTSDTTPDFSWNAVTDNSVTYELQIDDAQDFATTVYYRTGISGTTHTAENVLPNATLYWRVRAKDSANNYGTWSGNWSLIINISLPATVTLSSPASGTYTTDQTPDLSWNSVTGTGITYQLQLATDQQFTAVVYDLSGISGTSQTVGSTLASGTYYWRVRAKDSLNNYGGWSGGWELGIDVTAPSMVSLTINNDASSTSSLLATLSLSASDAHSGVYQMCFSNQGSSWSSWEPYSTSKSWTLPSGEGTKTVYAKVRDRALNESNTLSDSIQYQPPADTTPPTLTVVSPTTTEVNENLTVSVSASDPSGIDITSIAAKLDNAPVDFIFSEGVVTIELMGLELGDHEVWLMVADTVGNPEELTISFKVVAEIPPTATYTLILPTGAVTTEQVAIQVNVTNNTSEALIKNCEIRLGEFYTLPFTLDVGGNETEETPLTIYAAGNTGAYSITLYDLDNNRTLATGVITLAPAPPSSILPFAILACIFVALISIGVLYTKGKLKFGWPLKGAREEEMAPTLKPGEGYLVESQKPTRAFEIFEQSARSGLPSFLVTLKDPEEMKKRYDLDDTHVVWLSRQEVKGAISPGALDILRDAIIGFVEKNRGGVVLLSGLEYMVTVNGFVETLRFLHDVLENITINRAILIVPVDPRTFEKQQLARLERDMELIT